MALRYDVSKWQGWLWEDHCDTEEKAAEVVSEGEESFEQFSDFSKEVFHRVYSFEEKPLEPGKEGFDWADKFHQSLTETYEFQQMQENCKGDELFSGVSSQCLLKNLLESVPKPEEKLEDPEKIQQKMDSIQQAMDQVQQEPGENPTEEQQNIQDALQQQMQDAAQAKQDALQAASEYAQGVDPSQIRNAIRKAVDEASKEKEEIQAAMKAFGSEFSKTGTPSDKKAMLEMLKKIRGNSKLQRIAKLAGRLKNIALSQQRNKTQYSHGEIVGVEYGNNIAKQLPSEALYMDDTAEVLWYKKYQELALTQYKNRSREKETKGPLVLCVDCSGSMAGGNAEWAGAINLAFLEIARKQKRACAVIFFNGHVQDKVYFPKGQTSTPEQLLAIADFPVSGGTDFEYPLTEAINIIQKEKDFMKADILFITDGECSVSDSFMDGYIKAKKAASFSTYSMMIGSYSPEVLKKFSDDVVLLGSIIDDEEKMHGFFGKVW